DAGAAPAQPARARVSRGDRPLRRDEPLLPARSAVGRRAARWRAAIVRAVRGLARQLLRSLRRAGLRAGRVAVVRAVRRALPGGVAAALRRRPAGADRVGAAFGAALAGER